jgi:hypothetical protein
MFRKKSISSLFFLFFGFSFFSSAQHSAAEHEGNLPKFYKQQIHFGFHIGINTADFRIHNVKSSEYGYDTLYWLNGGKNYSHPGIYDSLWLLPLKTIYHKPETGFNLGIVVDKRIHDYVRLRFLPSLSFSSRKIVYTYQEGDTTFTRERHVESTFIMFPLLVKLQSKRLGNFGAYVLGGGSYSIDLASDKKVDPASQLVRLKRNDFYGEAGGGVDFYLQYFKLGLEVKVLSGLRDILYHDGSKFATPIKRLNSHMVFFTMTFEG